MFTEPHSVRKEPCSTTPGGGPARSLPGSASSPFPAASPSVTATNAGALPPPPLPPFNVPKAAPSHPASGQSLQSALQQAMPPKLRRQSSAPSLLAAASLPGNAQQQAPPMLPPPQATTSAAPIAAAATPATPFTASLNTTIDLPPSVKAKLKREQNRVEQCSHQSGAGLLQSPLGTIPAPSFNPDPEVKQYLDLLQAKIDQLTQECGAPSA